MRKSGRLRIKKGNVVEKDPLVEAELRGRYGLSPNKWLRSLPRLHPEMLVAPFSAQVSH